MYGINSKNGGALRGVWLTQADAERVACQQSRNDAKAGTWYVTDKNQQRVAAFQNGSDVSEREGIAREKPEVFRVIDQRGNVHEAFVTWRSGEFKMRRRVVTIGKQREEFNEEYAKRACVAVTAGRANIAVAEILADGEPTRAELLAAAGGAR
jgi:hypothetical protein